MTSALALAARAAGEASGNPDHDLNPEHWERIARAVLMAVRDEVPAEEFTHTQEGSFKVQNFPIPATPRNAVIAFQRMIDAILAEKPE